MYHIYHTEGIILASVPTGESDRFFHILTPDLGLIPVVARGSRALASKLRYHLVEYGHVGLDLVRGKDVWTLTGVLPMEDARPLTSIGHTGMRRLSVFARRLIHGEGTLLDVYTDTLAFRHMMEDVQDTGVAESIFLAFQIRFLASLGYASPDEVLTSIVATPFDTDIVGIIKLHHVRIRSIIDDVLKETHL